MAYKHPEDRIADRQTEAFLKQCEAEGRLTAKERAEISPDRGGVSYAKPNELLRVGVLVSLLQEETGWPEEDAIAFLDRCLTSRRLTARHLELYLNYPVWSQQELAEAFSMPQYMVSRHIAAVRRAWPGLRFDVSYEGDYGVPALHDMLRIEHYDCSDRLDDSRVEWF
jgi:hypothetical protein